MGTVAADFFTQKRSDGQKNVREVWAHWGRSVESTRPDCKRKSFFLRSTSSPPLYQRHSMPP